MLDLVFTLSTIFLFVVARLYVSACDRLNARPSVD